MSVMTEEQRALVESNVRLARWCVKRFAATTGTMAAVGMQRDEIEQTALLGLMRAARRFDPARGVTFHTYAVAVIQNELRHACEEAGKQLARTKTTYRFDEVERFSGGAPEPACEGSINSTHEESVKRKGIVGHKLTLPRHHRRPAASACHTAIPDAAEGAPPPTEAVERALGKLDARTRDIVAARFGLYGDAETLKAIAVRWGITKERVRQIQIRALRELRAVLDHESAA